MLGLTGLELKLSTTRTLALALFVSVLGITFIPATAYAEDAPSSQPTSQTGQVVESPSGVMATSSTTNRTIVWKWSAPAGGLTPDATDPAETPPVERSTDIIRFGYELSKADAVVASGAVASDILTVTTPVTENGDYTLYVWSITRAGDVSAKVVGGITIVTPVVTSPPAPEAVVPVVTRAPAPASMPVRSTRTAAPKTAVIFSTTPGYVANIPGAEVLAVSNNSTQDTTNKRFDLWGVVTAVPWYAWAGIVIVGYVVKRILWRVVLNL